VVKLHVTLIVRCAVNSRKVIKACILERAGVLSVSQTRWSGILWQIICVIRLLDLTVLGVS